MPMIIRGVFSMGILERLKSFFSKEKSEEKKEASKVEEKPKTQNAPKVEEKPKVVKKEKPAASTKPKKEDEPKSKNKPNRTKSKRKPKVSPKPNSRAKSKTETKSNEETFGDSIVSGTKTSESISQKTTEVSTDDISIAEEKDKVSEKDEEVKTTEEVPEETEEVEESAEEVSEETEEVEETIEDEVENEDTNDNDKKEDNMTLLTDTELINDSNRDKEFTAEFIDAGIETVKHCFQCGTCSGGCPSGRRTPYKVRQIVRKCLLGLKEDVITDEALWMCTTCYTCQERCPRSVEIVSIIKKARNVAAHAGYMAKPHKMTGVFVMNTGHGVPINDATKALRAKIGLAEVPPTTHSFPEALAEVQKICKITGFDELIGYDESTGGLKE